MVRSEKSPLSNKLILVVLVVFSHFRFEQLLVESFVESSLTCVRVCRHDSKLLCSCWVKRTERKSRGREKQKRVDDLKMSVL